MGPDRALAGRPQACRVRGGFGLSDGGLLGGCEVFPERFVGLRTALPALLLAAALAGVAGCGGRELGSGRIVGPARSVESRAALRAAQERSAPGEREILFGDLHVHTSYSIDAYVFSLPVFGGEGAHPPADACDFARYCAAVDFFSINDHAEAMTPERWQATRESIRACNARAGDPADPDLVAYVGYEWTQAGATPETHYGHKNVIFRGLADDELPARVIGSLPDGTMKRARGVGMMAVLEALPRVGGAYADFLWWIRRMTEIPDCPAGVDTRALPPECRENASTPDVLFEKLAQSGLEPLVIPHGLAWGIHAPPGCHHREPAHPLGPRSGAPAPDRGVLRPRQLRGVPAVARVRPVGRGARLSGADRRLPGLLLARRGDRARALRRSARRRLRGARRGGPASRDGGRRLARTWCCPTPRPRTGSTATSVATASSRP